MNNLNCTIPPYDELVRMTQEGEIVADDSVAGQQLLALVCALKAANDARAKAVA